MELPPGLAASRRLIAIVGAALAVVAVVGALAYASQDTGNGCGSGWAASRKPIARLTQAEKDEIVRTKRNGYQAASEKAKPDEACRRAGEGRLVRAGLGAGLVLLPIAGILAFLYWPKREELSDPVDLEDEPGGPQPFVPDRVDGWPGR